MSAVRPGCYWKYHFLVAAIQVDWDVLKADAWRYLIRSGKFVFWTKLFARLVGSTWIFFLFVVCERVDAKFQFYGLSILLGYCFPSLLCYLSVYQRFIYILHHIIFQLR